MINPIEILIEIRSQNNEIKAQQAEILQWIRDHNKQASPDTVSPIISSHAVKVMTGWPNSTFYEKVNQMPEGIVIRGKSKRLLFDRERLMNWLKTPVAFLPDAADEGDLLPFGPIPQLPKKGKSK